MDLARLDMSSGTCGLIGWSPESYLLFDILSSLENDSIEKSIGVAWLLEVVFVKRIDPCHLKVSDNKYSWPNKKGYTRVT